MKASLIKLFDLKLTKLSVELSLYADEKLQAAVNLYYKPSIFFKSLLE